MTTQPTLFPTPARPPHPGSACCDLSQDLAGWIAAQRTRTARDWRWSRAWRARGDRLRRAATRAYVRDDCDTGRALDGLSVHAHGVANAWSQRALIRDGDVDRVEAAHRWRLGVEVRGVA